MKKAIIIGGGIGGLTLANALKPLSLEVEIYEAAPELKEVGAGILMGTNAMMVLKELGFSEEVEAEGKRIDSGNITDTDWRVLQSMPLKQIEKKYSISTIAIHRGKLQKILAKGLSKNVPIHLNKRAISIENDGKPKVSFEDGTRIKADFLIGADGLNSVVRKHLFPYNQPKYLGQTCWRGTLRYRLPASFKNNISEGWGKKGRFAMIEIADDLVYWYSVIKTKEGERDNPATIKADLKRHFDEFPPVVADLIDKTSVENILRNDIYELKPQKRWHRGHIGLIGDAIHATSPNLGQGGAQAIEDGLALAHCLKAEKDFDTAFQKLEKMRYWKAKYVTDNSRLMGIVAHWENNLLIKFRNFLMRQIPQNLFIKRFEKLYNRNY